MYTQLKRPRLRLPDWPAGVPSVELVALFFLRHLAPGFTEGTGPMDDLAVSPNCENYWRLSIRSAVCLMSTCQCLTPLECLAYLKTVTLNWPDMESTGRLFWQCGTVVASIFTKFRIARGTEADRNFRILQASSLTRK